MSVMAVPLPADKLGAWEEWLAELGDARKAEFDDMNERHGLTRHEAHLQQTPDGGFLVIAVHEGPGGEDFMAGMIASDHEFDRWFIGRVADLHGMDPSAPPPPPSVRRL